MNSVQVVFIATFISMGFGLLFGYYLFRELVLPTLVHMRRMDFLTGINLLLTKTSGMNAENQKLISEGLPPKYTEADFNAIADEFRKKYLDEKPEGTTDVVA